MSRILVIQGPNLNLLGRRERDVYGSITLEEIHEMLRKRGRDLGVEVETFQSNHEGEIVEVIQGAREGGYEAIIINPAGYTHTSVAIRDALVAVDMPYIEVHISNIHAREPFRRRSLISEAASGVLFGFGYLGYILALQGVHEMIKPDRPK